MTTGWSPPGAADISAITGISSSPDAAPLGRAMPAPRAGGNPTLCPGDSASATTSTSSSDIRVMRAEVARREALARAAKSRHQAEQDQLDLEVAEANRALALAESTDRPRSREFSRGQTPLKASRATSGAGTGAVHAAGDGLRTPMRAPPSVEYFFIGSTVGTPVGHPTGACGPDTQVVREPAPTLQPKVDAEAVLRAEMRMAEQMQAEQEANRNAELASINSLSAELQACLECAEQQTQYQRNRDFCTAGAALEREYMSAGLEHEGEVEQRLSVYEAEANTRHEEIVHAVLRKKREQHEELVAEETSAYRRHARAELLSHEAAVTAQERAASSRRGAKARANGGTGSAASLQRALAF